MFRRASDTCRGTAPDSLINNCVKIILRPQSFTKPTLIAKQWHYTTKVLHASNKSPSVEKPI